MAGGPGQHWQAAGEMPKLLPLIISRRDVLCFQVMRKLAQNEIKKRRAGGSREGTGETNPCHSGGKKITLFEHGFYHFHSLLHETASYFPFLIRASAALLLSPRDTPGIKIFKDDRAQTSFFCLFFVLSHSQAAAHQHTERWRNLPERTTAGKIAPNCK